MSKLEPHILFPKTVKADKNFQRTVNLIPKIVPSSGRILVEVLPFSKRPKSKLILPGAHPDEIVGMTFFRAKVLTIGQDCSIGCSIGDEVYFDPNMGKKINYPNPDHTDKKYIILYENVIEYYVKKS